MDEFRGGVLIMTCRFVKILKMLIGLFLGASSERKVSEGKEKLVIAVR